MDPLACKYIAAGMTVIGMASAAGSVGLIMSAALTGISRNPGSAEKMSTFVYVGLALAEAMGLFSLVLGFVLLVL